MLWVRVATKIAANWRRFAQAVSKPVGCVDT
uniref:Uncharacterized protein n=1 Tax=Anguilla anguilla TaxID=7936 RepID=A0A0E9UDI4_ANGAN